MAEPTAAQTPADSGQETESRVDTALRRVIIAANPKSGAASGLSKAESIRDSLLNSEDLAVEILTDPASIESGIKSAQESGELRYVIAAGGDGTAGMVAQWLDSETPLAVFPLGTENLLAKQWKMPNEIEKFVEILNNGHCVACDAGDANGRMFLLHATVGFDAEVVRLLHEERTGHIRHWSYFSPLLRSIRDYHFPVLSIRTSVDRRPLRARWAFIFNFPSYAMGLPIVSDAEATDGLLDLCTFRGGRLFNGLMYFFGIVFRFHRSWRDTHLERTTWLRIEADEEVPYQLDGDPGGFLPLEIKVMPKRFRLIVPNVSSRGTS